MSKIQVSRTFLQAVSRFRDAPAVVPLPFPASPPDLFLHNWGQRTRLISAFDTDVVRARTLAESRRGLQDRPNRRLQIVYRGLDPVRAGALQAFLFRRADERLPIPLLTDVAPILTVQGSTIFTIPPKGYRFYTGARIAVFNVTDGPSAVDVFYTTIAVDEIQNFFPGTIRVVDALPGSITTDSFVVPLIDCEIQRAGQTQSSHTDYYADFAIEAQEVFGKSALPAVIGDTLPPSFPVYQGAPILDLSNDWSERPTSSVIREGDDIKLGRGRLVYASGSRPRLEMIFQFRLDRVGFSRLLEFFEAMKGRLHSFWALQPHSIWEPKGVTTTQLDISPVGQLADVSEFYDHVGLRWDDGSVDVRGISSVVDNGSVWSIIFDSAIVLGTKTLANLVQGTSAHKARFSREDMIETWQTDQHVTVSLAVEELLEEKVVEIA